MSLVLGYVLICSCCFYKYGMFWVLSSGPLPHCHWRKLLLFHTLLLQLAVLFITSSNV